MHFRQYSKFNFFVTCFAVCSAFAVPYFLTGCSPKKNTVVEETVVEDFSSVPRTKEANVETSVEFNQSHEIVKKDVVFNKKIPQSLEINPEWVVSSFYSIAGVGHLTLIDTISGEKHHFTSNKNIGGIWIHSFENKGGTIFLHLTNGNDFKEYIYQPSNLTMAESGSSDFSDYLVPAVILNSPLDGVVDLSPENKVLLQSPLEGFEKQIEEKIEYLDSPMDGMAPVNQIDPITLNSPSDGL